MQSRHNTFVRPKKQIWTWIAVMLLFIVELFGYTWCRVQCIGIGYEIAGETQNHQKLLKWQKHLMVELARLKSPDRVVRIARTKLNLVMPDPKQIVVIQ